MGHRTAERTGWGQSSEYSCECIGANGFGVGKARGEGNGDGSEPQLHWAHCSGPKGAAVALTRVRRATVQPFALHRRGISLFQLSPPIPHRGQGRFGFGLLHDATDTIADAIVRPLRARGSAEGRTSREELLRLLHDPDRRPAGVDRTAQPDRRGEVLRVPLEECAEGLRRAAATSAVQCSGAPASGPTVLGRTLRHSAHWLSMLLRLPSGMAWPLDRGHACAQRCAAHIRQYSVAAGVVCAVALHD